MKDKPRTRRAKPHSSRRANQLDTLLGSLTRAELIKALQDAQASYFFRHALVQETAYQSLLKNDRKRLHRAIAVTLERETGRTEDRAADLARHFAEAGDDTKTGIYAERAGDGAARVFAFAEATFYYEQALAALSRTPADTDQVRRRVDLIVKIVAMSLRTAGPEASLERLRVAEALLADLESDPADRERLARVHFWMGDAYSHLNLQREAIGYLQSVLAAAQEGITDETLLAIPSNVIGRALVAQGKFQDAEPLLARAAPLLEKSANWYEWILAVGFLGFSRAAQGDTLAGLEQSKHAFARANALGTLIGLGDSHIFTSFIYHQREEYETGLEHGEAALRAAMNVQDQLLIYLAHNACAWALARLEQFHAAEEHFRIARELTAAMGGQLFFTDLFQAAYAELALLRGDTADAVARAQQALEIAQVVGSGHSQALALRVLAQAGGRAAQFEASTKAFSIGNALLEVARTRELWADWELEHHPTDAQALAHAQELYTAAREQFQTSQLAIPFQRVQSKLEKLAA